MTPAVCYRTIVDLTLRFMAASPTIAIPATDQARVLLLAIAGQESRWKHRRQIGMPYYPQKVGARSLWQFESTWGGPVAIDDLLMSTHFPMEAICSHLDIPCDKYSLYEACAWNDMLACAMARLLLWLHPAPLPALGDHEAAWLYYLRQWRPGAPHRDTWNDCYDQSLAAVRSG